MRSAWATGTAAAAAFVACARRIAAGVRIPTAGVVCGGNLPIVDGTRRAVFPDCMGPQRVIYFFSIVEGAVVPCRPYSIRKNTARDRWTER